MEIAKSDRLNKLPPYLFAELRSRIAAAKAAGIEIINLGIGDPDKPTPDAIVDELIRSVRDVDDRYRHRYGCDVPVDAFPSEVCDYYRRRFGVVLRSDQVVTTSGSKDAIVQFCLGIMNPGEIGIAPAPGYPTYNIGHVFAGSSTFGVPLLKQNNFLLDFDAIPRDVSRLAKVLWLNYPNNPTTAVASLDFFRRAVEYGRENKVLIAHDLAYGENCYDGYRAPSILEVEGADEVAVEFFSLSKGFNMTGWRAGAVVGNSHAVATLRAVKDNVDNGTFRPIQFAAAKALIHSDELVPSINTIYQSRRDLVIEGMNSAGWSLEKPKATIYVWAPVPERYNGSSAAFCTDLLEKTGVVVTPGLGYGEWGEGFFRLSLSSPNSILEKAISRISEMGYY